MPKRHSNGAANLGICTIGPTPLPISSRRSVCSMSVAMRGTRYMQSSGVSVPRWSRSRFRKCPPGSPPNWKNDPLLKADDELRLFALIVKGDIDGELNAGPMRLDWEAVQDLARRLRNERWVNRAGGEIGFSYYLEGDLTRARQMVGAALLTATMTGDVGGQIRYLAAIGTALVLAENARDALSYFDKALKAANAHPEVGYQFLIHEGRVLAYKQLGQWKEARAISDEMLAEARTRKKYVKECQGLAVPTWQVETIDAGNFREPHQASHPDRTRRHVAI